MSVEMNGMSVGGCLFGIVISVDCFVLLECNLLGKMVGTDMVMEVMVEVVVMEAVDVFLIFRSDCFENMMGVRVVIEVMVGVVVLVWWRWFVV